MHNKISLPPGSKVLAFTGHRPNKLGGYDMQSAMVTKIVGRIISEMKLYLPDYIITGMALGIDQIAAKLAILNHIPFIAAIPFKNQDKNWPPASQQAYQALLTKAHTIINVSGKDHYRTDYMQLRNEWMVDNCTKLIGVWDGSPGGTGNCLQYASLYEPRDGVTIINPQLL